MDEAENQINDLEHKEAKKKNHQSDQEEKRTQKNEDCVSNLRNNFKQSNIRFIGVPEREEEDQETGNLFEKIMKEKFPNLMKVIDMQIQEAQRVPKKIDTETYPKTHHN